MNAPSVWGRTTGGNKTADHFRYQMVLVRVNKVYNLGFIHSFRCTVRQNEAAMEISGSH